MAVDYSRVMQDAIRAYNQSQGITQQTGQTATQAQQAHLTQNNTARTTSQTVARDTGATYTPPRSRTPYSQNITPAASTRNDAGRLTTATPHADRVASFEANNPDIGLNMAPRNDRDASTGTGYSYVDRYGIPHVTSDLRMAMLYSGDGKVYNYEGAHKGGYARDAQGQRAVFEGVGNQVFANNRDPITGEQLPSNFVGAGQQLTMDHLTGQYAQGGALYQGGGMPPGPGGTPPPGAPPTGTGLTGRGTPTTAWTPDGQQIQAELIDGRTYINGERIGPQHAGLVIEAGGTRYQVNAEGKGIDIGPAGAPGQPTGGPALDPTIGGGFGLPEPPQMLPGEAPGQQPSGDPAMQLINELNDPNFQTNLLQEIMGQYQPQIQQAERQIAEQVAQAKEQADADAERRGMFNSGAMAQMHAEIDKWGSDQLTSYLAELQAQAQQQTNQIVSQRMQQAQLMSASHWSGQEMEQRKQETAWDNYFKGMGLQLDYKKYSEGIRQFDLSRMDSLEQWAQSMDLEYKKFDLQQHVSLAQLALEQGRLSLSRAQYRSQQEAQSAQNNMELLQMRMMAYNDLQNLLSNPENADMNKQDVMAFVGLYDGMVDKKLLQDMYGIVNVEFTKRTGSTDQEMNRTGSPSYDTSVWERNNPSNVANMPFSQPNYNFNYPSQNMGSWGNYAPGGNFRLPSNIWQNNVPVPNPLAGGPMGTGTLPPPVQYSAPGYPNLTLGNTPYK